MSDTELVCLLNKGDDLSFTEIYNRYWDKLYYVAYRLLKDTDAAEEIVQDVFLALWRKRETLQIQSLSQYLAAMTRYAIYRQVLKEKTVREKENIIGLITAEAISEINIDHKILLEIIAELSNKLPEKCRLVFQYNKLQDQPLSEVAEQLNISQKTAEAHLTKALRIIRTSLGSAGGEFLTIMMILEFLKH